MQLADRWKFLAAVESEKRTEFDGFVNRTHIKKALSLSPDEALKIAGYLVHDDGYLETTGVGYLLVKVTQKGSRYLATEAKLKKDKSANNESPPARQINTANPNDVDPSDYTVTEL